MTRKQVEEKVKALDLSKCSTPVKINFGRYGITIEGYMCGTSEVIEYDYIGDLYIKQNGFMQDLHIDIIWR